MDFFKLSLDNADNVSFSTDLVRLDMSTMTKTEFVATLNSYLPQVAAALRGLDPKALELSSIAMVMFFAAACAVSENGKMSVDLFNQLYENYTKSGV